MDDDHIEFYDIIHRLQLLMPSVHGETITKIMRIYHLLTEQHQTDERNAYVRELEALITTEQPTTSCASSLKAHPSTNGASESCTTISTYLDEERQASKMLCKKTQCGKWSTGTSHDAELGTLCLLVHRLLADRKALAERRARDDKARAERTFAFMLDMKLRVVVETNKRKELEDAFHGLWTDVRRIVDEEAQNRPAIEYMTVESHNDIVSQMQEQHTLETRRVDAEIEENKRIYAERTMSVVNMIEDQLPNTIQAVKEEMHEEYTNLFTEKSIQFLDIYDEQQQQYAELSKRYDALVDKLETSRTSYHMDLDEIIDEIRQEREHHQNVIRRIESEFAKKCARLREDAKAEYDAKCDALSNKVSYYKELLQNAAIPNVPRITELTIQLPEEFNADTSPMNEEETHEIVKKIEERFEEESNPQARDTKGKKTHCCSPTCEYCRINRFVARIQSKLAKMDTPSTSKQ